MKKFILLLCLIFCIGASVMADEPKEEEQDIELEIVDPLDNSHGRPRTPARPPHVLSTRD